MTTFQKKQKSIIGLTPIPILISFFRNFLLIVVALISTISAVCQDFTPFDPSYDSLKTSGYFEVTKQKMYQGDYPEFKVKNNQGKGLLIPLDGSFTQILGHTDDGYTETPISLPFTFQFYGENLTEFYINNNGNISFNGPYFTFTPLGFPVNNFPLLAPFWADVDTRPLTSGVVYYKIEAHRVTVIWDGVGYYELHTDKLNTYEVIFTDKQDALIGIGNNVAFSYGDMQWTTGDASGGTNGFGGVPATVGLNKGNGIDFHLVGRFDHEGTDYDGPGGNADGVSYLDNKIFTFLADTSTNIAPVPESFPPDTVEIYIGDTYIDTIQFNSPENDQITTVTVNQGILSSFNYTTYPGQKATVEFDLTGTVNNTGIWSVEFLATDNGNPPLSTTEFIDFKVINQPPEIISLPVLEATEDQLYTYNVQGTDPDIPYGDSLVYQLNTYPFGMTINPQNGMINWTPTNSDVGEHNIIIQVTDINGLYDFQDFILTVLNVNDPPVANAGQDQTVNSGELVTLNGSGSFDIDSDSLYFSWNSLTEIILSDSTSIYPEFIAPNICTENTYSFTLSVFDGEFISPNDTIEVTVLPGFPDVSINPVSYSDTIVEGYEKQKPLVVKNNGYCDLEYTIQSSVDWISGLPVFGSIAGSDSTVISFTLDATQLEPGNYQSDISLSTNDPDNPLLIIPVTLKVNEGLNVIAEADPDEICIGSSVQLNATPTGGYGNYSYLWTSDPPGFNSTEQNPLVSPTVTTVYSVVVSDVFEQDTASVSVSVFLLEPPSTVQNMLPPDSSMIPQPSLTFSWQPAQNASLYDLYIWESTGIPPTQPSVSDISSIQYTYSSLNFATEYKWKVVAKNPCFETESQVQIFEIADLPDLIITDIQVPANPSTGQNVQISWTTFNQGNNSTMNKSWYDAIYLSVDDQLDVNVDVYLGSFQNLTSLPPNTGYTQAKTVTLPEDMFNELYVIVNSDHYSKIYETNEDNNFSAHSINVSLTPPPDLVVNDIIIPSTAFSGDQISVQWEILNDGSGNILNQSWVDKIYISEFPEFSQGSLSLLGSYYCNFDLLVGETYTGQKQVKIPNYISGDYYIHIYTDASNNIFEHANEDNNTYSEGINIVLTPPPDLVILDVNNPTSASNNEIIEISWTLKNNGAGSTISYWTDKIFISPDSLFNEANFIQIGQKFQNLVLQPGESQNTFLNLNAPKNLAGTYYVYVYADFNNQVFEFENEDNNVSRSDITLQIDCPDLIASNIVNQDTAWSGQNITLNWSINNAGAGNLINQTVKDKLYISENSNFSFEKVELGSINYSNNINSGATIQKSKSVKVPDGYNGVYYLFVVSNFDHSVFENSQYENNLAIDSIYIKMSPYPDLSFDSTNSPQNILLGYPDILFYRIENSGEANIFGKTWNDKIYVSSYPTFNINNAHELANQNHALPLNVSGTYSENITVLFPISSLQNINPGYIHFVTDVNNNVYETDELNNISTSSPIQFSLPAQIDLEVNSASTNAYVTQGGQSIQINWQVINNSTPTNIWGISSWHDAVYFSTDQVWDENDIFIQSWQIQTALNTGGSYNLSKSLTIPHGYSGNYYFLMVSDYAKVTNDETYDNNVMSLTGSYPIFIKSTAYPDLQVEDFESPLEGIAGQPVKFIWEVSNIGFGETFVPAWTDKIYLSADFTINSGDINIASKTHNTVLNLYESYIDSVEIFLPNNVYGNYIVIFKTDANDVQYEAGSGEENNIAFSSISIMQQPMSDLIVSEVSFPDSVTTGESANIQWTLKNIGLNPASGYLKDIVYFSTDSIWNFSDPKFGAKTSNINIAPLMSQTLSLNNIIPGVVPGSYNLTVQTNVQNNIAEEDYLNNTGISTNQIEVSMDELILDVEKSDILVNQVGKFYQVIIPDTLEDETLVISLTGDSLDGSNELYLSFDSIPSRSNHAFSATVPFSGNQELAVPEIDIGGCYLLVYGITSSGTSQNIELLAEIRPFEIRSVDAPQGGNAGNVTLKIEGAKFESNMEVTLTNALSTPIFCNNLYFENSTRIYATFNINGAQVGIYDVVAEKTDNSTAALPDGFEIIDANQNSFYNQIDTTGFVCYIENIGFEDLIATNIQHPATTRPNWIVPITIHFANNGSVDIPAPGRLLVSLAGVPLSFNPQDFSENLQELYIEFVENNGPPGILRPGAQGSITAYSKANTIPHFLMKFVLTR